MTLDTFERLVGNLARPFSIIATSFSAAVVPIVIVWRIAPDRLDLVAAAAFVGALYAGVGALYWGKAWENQKTEKAKAEVEKARAAVPAAADDGELPPDKRVAL